MHELMCSCEIIAIEGYKVELPDLFARFELDGGQLEVDAYVFGCKCLLCGAKGLMCYNAPLIYLYLRFNFF